MFYAWRSQPLRSSAWAARLAVLLVIALFVVLGLATSDARAAQPRVGLGTADSFAVLAGSTMTNTGPSTINGDVGVSPGLAIVGVPPATVNGTVHAGDAVAAQAQSDLTIAYDDAAGRTPPTVAPADLVGATYKAGVYASATSLELSGDMTLDAEGDPNAVFIFQAGSTLTTASGSHVNLINGAQACNVFWQVGTSATLGTASDFMGNILALASISMNDAVTVHGRALARNGAVTLINDTITPAHCATAAGGDDGGTTGGGTTGGGTTGGGTTTTPGGGGTAGSGGTAGGATNRPGGTAGTPGSVSPTTSGPIAGHNGTAFFKPSSHATAKAVARGTSGCVHGSFRAVVTGRLIRKVVFSQGGQILAVRNKAPFAVLVGSGEGIHTVTARITFRDRTPRTTRRMRFRTCSEATRDVNARAPLASRTPGFTG